MPAPRAHARVPFISNVHSLLPVDVSFGTRARCVDEETQKYFVRPRGDAAILSMAVCGLCTERPVCLAGDMLANSPTNMVGVVGGMREKPRRAAALYVSDGELSRAQGIIEAEWGRIDAALGGAAIHAQPYF